MIKPGEEWGTPTSAAPDIDVTGTDRDLAAAITSHPGALIRFHPTKSDLARAVGVDAGRLNGVEVALDMLRLADGSLAANMIVAGVPPDHLRRFSRRIRVTVEVDGREWFAGRATTVVVATGQFLRALDVVPRGHPGDGRAEVQVFAPRIGERAAMRARLANGTHLPHPRIAFRIGRRIDVRWEVERPLEMDGAQVGKTAGLTIDVVPGGSRLLV